MLQTRPEACRQICSALGFPSEAATDDDALDAFVGHRLAEEFIIGEAEWFGSPEQGGYVLPNTEGARELYGALGAQEPAALPLGRRSCRTLSARASQAS